MSTKGKVLLTGGSGFIASHILDLLLEQGYSVVTTVRTTEKGEAVLSSLLEDKRLQASFAIVDDVSREGAFGNVLTNDGPFEYVIHTASPYQFKVEDPVRDLLDPALRGTTGLLRSIQKLAPSVKRVVLTSSSAAMLNPAKHAAVYNESCWRPMTWAEAQLPQNAYEASKVFAERAAWALVNGSDDVETAGETAATGLPRATAFDLAVINCTYTFGPVQRWLSSLKSVNASNQRIRDLVLGKWTPENGGVPLTRPVFTWVDVRDVALAHVQAMETPEAGGHRFYVVGGHFSNGRLVNIVRDAWTGDNNTKKLVGRLPSADNTPDDLPADVYQFNNQQSRDVLGLNKYRTLEESVMDIVDSLLLLEGRVGGGDNVGAGLVAGK